MGNTDPAKNEREPELPPLFPVRKPSGYFCSPSDLAFPPVLRPEDFPEDLRKLVLGLTYKDISNRNSGNARSRRWGWQEVENWLKGIKQPVPGMFPDEAPAFLPYVFDKTRYTDEETMEVDDGE